MISLTEAKKIYNKKKREEEARINELAANAIEKCSNAIKDGKFYVSGVTQNEKALEKVIKAFEREGFIVEVQAYEFTRNRGAKGTKETKYSLTFKVE